MADLTKEQKINAFIEELKAEGNAQMSGLQLLDRIEKAQILTESELGELRAVNVIAQQENDTFKSSVLSNLVYTRYDKIVEHINEQKLNGVTLSMDEIIDSGMLTKETSPLDVAALAYYSKTFTPVNVMKEGQFTVNQVKATDAGNPLGTDINMDMSYKNGVYRADGNIAMAMTVMSEGPDGKPQLNVAFRGTDADSRNQMVEPDGSVIDRKNGMIGLGGGYFTKTYLDMAGHNKFAFTPLINSITEAVKTLDWQKAREAAPGEYSMESLKAYEDNRLSVLGTGHSLGGGMLEEWTKRNSRPDFTSVEQRVNGVASSMEGLTNQGILKSLEAGYERELQNEFVGDVNLKSIAFGSPSNDRNGFGKSVEKLTRGVKNFINSSKRLGLALMTASGLRGEKFYGNNPESSFLVDFLAMGAKKLIALETYTNMLKGPLGSVLNVIGSKNEFNEMQRKHEAAVDGKILERDFHVYNTPLDPVGRFIVSSNFSKAAPNLNIIDPIAQKDHTFSMATQGLKERELEVPQNGEEINKGFMATLKDFGKSIAATLTKVTLKTLELGSAAAVVGGITSQDLVRTSVDAANYMAKEHFNIEYHSMKAYVGTSMIKASPVRNLDTPIAEMSGMDKLAMLVDLKSKPDIMNMEVLVKESGLENVVRDYRESLAKKAANPYSYDDFKFKANAWEDMPGADTQTQQMTKTFQDLKENFGPLLTLSSKDVPSVSVDLAADLNKAAIATFEGDRMPFRFEEYKGQGLLQKGIESIEFIEDRIAFKKAVDNFNESINTADLRAEHFQSNPMLRPQENKVLYVEPPKDPFVFGNTVSFGQGKDKVYFSLNTQQPSGASKMENTSVQVEMDTPRISLTLDSGFSPDKPSVERVEGLKINRSLIRENQEDPVITLSSGSRFKMT